MRRSTILVVEDEPDIREMLHYNLTREGFDVLSAADGAQALELARRSLPDLVLLDLLIPGVDGIEVCRKLKMDGATAAIPIIMVTAKSDETDVVLGLGVGADDYVAKPYSPRELLARVRALLRRTPAREERQEGERLVRQGVSIDTVSHEVHVDGRVVPFTATEFRLLHFMAAHPGRVFTREQLIGRIISEGASVTDRTIDVHIRALRKKLGEWRELIETIRGVGYRFSRSETPPDRPA